MRQCVVGKKLKSDLNISSSQLFSKYPSLKSDLSSEAVDIITESVDKNKEVKTKKSEDEIESFFRKVKSYSGTMGVGSDEAGELEKINKYKGQQMDGDDMGQGKVSYDSYDTYDRDSGSSEGHITLGHGGKEGKLVPVKINETSVDLLRADLM